MDSKLFIVENYHNMSNKKIIKELNISERKFYELIKQLGLKKESPIKGQKINDMDINQFIIDNYADMKNEDIIKIVNVNQTYLSSYIWVKKRKLNYLLNGLLYKNGKSFEEKD